MLTFLRKMTAGKEDGRVEEKWKRLFEKLLTFHAKKTGIISPLAAAVGAAKTKDELLIDWEKAALFIDRWSLPAADHPDRFAALCSLPAYFDLSEKLIEMVPTSPDRFCDHRALLETSLARLYRLGFFLRDVGGWQAKYSERN